MNNLSKEELEKILKVEGKVRGVVFQTDREYVLLRWKKEGLEKLKQKEKEFGLEIPYEKAETMKWYPIGKRVASLLLIKETFDLKDEEIREMGSMAPKVSPIVKFFFKLFTPLSIFAKEIPRYWKEHYTLGELEVIKVSEKEKEMILHLKGIKIHPLFCLYLEGYFERVMKFLYPTSECKETKCPFLEDVSFHQYEFRW